MKLPYPLRWLVHNYRCGRWLRRVRAGERALSFERDAIASRHWRDHGRHLSDYEIDVIQEHDWAAQVERQWDSVIKSIERDIAANPKAFADASADLLAYVRGAKQ